MKESARSFLVGLFVIASLSVLGVLMVWFGETPGWLRRSEWILRITGVAELSGIGEGSTVNLNGVQIGRVKTLEFQNPERPDQGVVIVTGIKNVFSVPQGALARVYGATLGFGMGHIQIVLPPDVAAELLPKDGSAVIQGEMRSIIRELISPELIGSVEQTVKHIGDLAAAAKPVADNLARLLERRSVAETMKPGARETGLEPNLSTVIERLDDLLANVNAVLGDEDVQGDIKAAVADLKVATRELRETISLWKRESQRLSDNLNAGIDRTEEDLRQSFVKLNEVLDELDDAATSMAGLMREVAAGRGTAGLLARDDRLYEAAVLTLERLSEAIGTIQRIAGKIEEDGYISIGKVTPVGTFVKEFPVGPAGATTSEASR